MEFFMQILAALPVLLYVIFFEKQVVFWGRPQLLYAFWFLAIFIAIVKYVF